MLIEVGGVDTFGVAAQDQIDSPVLFRPAGRRDLSGDGLCAAATAAGSRSSTWVINSSRCPPEGRSLPTGRVTSDWCSTTRKPSASAYESKAFAVQSSGSLDFLDPWGNHIQVVDYHDIQFTKAPEILRGMKLDGLSKSQQALSELRAKGLSTD